MSKIYDLAIIGMGPAGYTASIYASRYQVSNVVVGDLPGGTASESHKICNFPTEIEISGLDLTEKMQNHAKALGGEEIFDRVEQISKDHDIFTIKMKNEKAVKAKTVLLATGLERKRLNIPGERELFNKGVAYCATCDAPMFKNKIVAVIGGGDTATTSAIFLSQIAKKVYQIYRGPELKSEPTWAEIVKKDPKITIIYNTNVTKIIGNGKVETIELDKKFHKSSSLTLDGVFIEIGSVPNTEIYSKLGIETTENGYIKIDKGQATNVEGIFSAGDITTGSNNFAQVITACSEGAIAALSLFRFLKREAIK